MDIDLAAVIAYNMTMIKDVAMLRSEHRKIEEPLEAILRLSQGLTPENVAALRSAHEEARRRLEPHLCQEEEGFYRTLRTQAANLTDKMLEQHRAIRELDAWLAELLRTWPESPTSRNVAELQRSGRQFHAQLQHHMLEEERDVFPLAERTLES